MLAAEAVQLARFIVVVVKHRQRGVVARTPPRHHARVALAPALPLFEMQDRLGPVWTMMSALHALWRLALARAQTLRAGLGAEACERARL